MGQGFCAFSQPLFIASPALLATYWFNEAERTNAITVGGTSNVIGNAVGFLLPTLFVDAEIESIPTARRQVSNALLTQGIISLVLLLLAIFSFQNKPKLPPGPNAVVPKETNLFGSYYKLIINFEFIKITA